MSHQRNIIVVEPDPYLAVTVEALLSNIHPTPELIAVADLDELREWARPTGTVVAGPSFSGKAATEGLRSFRDDHPAVRIVLAFDRRPGAAMRDLIAVGAEALVDPSDTADLRDAIVRAIDLGDRTVSAIRDADEGGETPLGQVFTVCSATGGCGKTFFSTNIAAALSRFTGARVALIDLDLQFGEVLTALRLRARNTIADAIAIDDDDELAALLPELLTTHESGIYVLPAPLDPAQADQIRPQDVLRVVKALKDQFDYVVVDTPTGLAETVLAALDQSTHLFVLAALDVSSVRNLRLFLQTLERLRIPSDDLSIVLNKDQTGVGIDAGQVEKLFPSGFRAKIPYSQDVPRSMNMGQPIMTVRPTAEASQRVVDALRDFMPDDAVASADEATTAEPVSFWRRHFKRPDAPLTSLTGSVEA